MIDRRQRFAFLELILARSMSIQQAAGLVVPYQVERPASVGPVLAPSSQLRFGIGHNGLGALRWGWCAPEEAHVWSNYEDSAIVFRVSRAPGESLDLVMTTIGYVVDSLGPQRVAVSVNGHSAGQIVHLLLFVPTTTIIALDNKDIRVGWNDLVIRFTPSYSRRPDRDGGLDRRAIGFALLGVAVRPALPS
jgi:hypothetical protein